MTCRACGDSSHRRSHRTAMERLLTSVAPLRRYRCRRCGRRRWGLRRPLVRADWIDVLLSR